MAGSGNAGIDQGENCPCTFFRAGGLRLSPWASGRFGVGGVPWGPSAFLAPGGGRRRRPRGWGVIYYILSKIPNAFPCLTVAGAAASGISVVGFAVFVAFSNGGAYFMNEVRRRLCLPGAAF